MSSFRLLSLHHTTSTKPHTTKRNLPDFKRAPNPETRVREPSNYPLWWALLTAVTMFPHRQKPPRVVCVVCGVISAWCFTLCRVFFPGKEAVCFWRFRLFFVGVVCWTTPLLCFGRRGKMRPKVSCSFGGVILLIVLCVWKGCGYLYYFF